MSSFSDVRRPAFLENMHKDCIGDGMLMTKESYCLVKGSSLGGISAVNLRFWPDISSNSKDPKLIDISPMILAELVISLLTKDGGRCQGEGQGVM